MPHRADSILYLAEILFKPFRLQVSLPVWP